MKARVSEIAPGTCFKQGKTLKKKLSDGQVVSVSPKGKVRTVTQKGDPLVSPANCSIPLLGAGLRRHPELMIEMGGRPRSIVDQKLK